MFVDLQQYMEHLPCFHARLLDQSIGDIKQQRKGHLNDLIELIFRVCPFEAIHAIEGEHAMQASQDGGGIVGIEEAEGDIEEVWPTAGKVCIQNLGKDRE